MRKKYSIGAIVASVVVGLVVGAGAVFAYAYWGSIGIEFKK